MLDLSGLTPSGVKHADGEAKLVWQIDGQTVETNFQRFLPVDVQVADRHRELQITWGDLADLPLTEAFYQDSAKKAKDLTVACNRFRTNGDTMPLIVSQPNTLPLSGAVFHMARTGSTLVHRLLSRTGKVLSVSEADAFDRVMQLTEAWSPEERNATVRDFVHLFGRPRRSTESYFIAKMSDVTTMWLPRFRSAFPGVPWIFVYRDPVEVMTSLLMGPSGNVNNWFRNRTEASKRLRMPALNDPGMWPAEFVALTLRRFCFDAVRAARQTPSGKFLAINYSRLPEAIWETIAPHFGIELTDADRAVMMEEAKFASKKKENVEFVPDSETKQTRATPFVRDLIERYVEPVIGQLKTLPQG